MSDFSLNKAQFKFFKSTAKQAAICSGLGGGKTYVLIFSQIVNEILKYPEGKHCFAALSYPQLKDISIPTFMMFFEEMRIPFLYHKSDKKFIINGRTELLMRSADTSERMRSVEIASLYCEELAYWRLEDFMVFLGRLRDKKGSMRMRAATTPNGLNWFYKYFIKEAKEGRVLYNTSTLDNKHLPSEYVQMLKDSYDEEMQEQEIGGKFINIGSLRTYYAFSEEKHTRNIRSNKVASVGMDFNVDPMTAVCGFTEGNKIYITDEIYLKNSNTFKIRDTIKQRHGTNMLIIPDATAKARKTSAVKSDHDLLREYFTVARVRNPSRKDRFNCINNLLGKGRLIIDEKCVNLINDLNNFCDDGADKKLGHISDALGYMCWYHFPIERELLRDTKRSYL